MKKKSFLKRKNLIKTFVIVVIVAISLISSSSISATISKILETKNLDMKIVEEKTSIAVEPSTGLAPEINPEKPILTTEKANNLDKTGGCMSLGRGTTMYGYVAYSTAMSNGPCHFDTEDPWNISKLSDETVTNFLSGGTWTCDKKWYCCQYGTGFIYTVTTDTGHITTVGGGGVNLNALAYDEMTNLMYGAGETSLYLIDMETGAQEVIGPFGSDVYYIIGMTFDSSGVLYGWSINDYLWIINTITGDAAQVGPLGIDLNYAQDGDFDRFYEDTLYLTAFTLSPNYGGYLYTCDKETGACTLVGAFPGTTEIDASMIPMTWCNYNDVGVKDVISPKDGYAKDDMDVIVQVKNYGTISGNNVKVNSVIKKDGNVEEYNETVFVNIEYGQTLDVEMPKWTPDDWHNTSNEYINYSIFAHVYLYGDINPGNDNMEKWFELYFGYFHDIGCTNLSGPENGPAKTFTMNATIKNLGQYDECCFKTYVEITELDVVSGLPLLPPEYEDFTCSGIINVSEEKELQFDDWTPAYLAEETSGTKMYSVKAWTDLNNPQDENPDNDLFSKTIVLDYYHNVGIKEVTSPNIYIIPGNQNINVTIENIGTFPEQDMTCCAEIYEYITNCTNGTLVYEDNITNIDIEQPLGGTETLIFDDYNFATEGVYHLDLNLVDDNDDYPDNNQMTYVIGAEGTPPTSTHKLNPANPNGDNGWYVSDITVTLSATDPSIGCDTDGSGIKEIKYIVNNMPGSVPGDYGSFNIHNDGTNIEVKYWAIDNVGNTETKHTFYINMDQKKPNVPEGIAYTAKKVIFFWYVTFSVECTDATSSMDRVEWALNDVVQNIVTELGPIYTWTFQWSSLLHSPGITFKATAYDKAGNSDFVTIISNQIQSNPISDSKQSNNQNLLVSLLPNRTFNVCLIY